MKSQANGTTNTNNYVHDPYSEHNNFQCSKQKRGLIYKQSCDKSKFAQNLLVKKSLYYEGITRGIILIQGIIIENN